MTEQLKTLMDKAADLDFAVVDVDAITGAGDRTVRRRRITTGIAGVAALAVVATGAVLLGDGGDQKTDFVDDPFRTDVPMWTEGSALHTPDRTFDLGVDVISFVRTSEGIVFMGLEGDERLGVYAWPGTGEPVRIGESDDPHLRADADQPYAGWLDKSGDDYEAVVFDQSTGDRIWSEQAQVEYSFPIVAIDDGRVFLADVDEGPTRVLDLASGQVTDLADPARYQYFMDVEGDLVAYLLEDAGGADVGVEVGHLGADGGGIEILADDAGHAVLSPGGRWVSVSDEHVGAYDTATGDAVEIGALGERQGFGYEWADADTLMVIAESEADHDVLELLGCEIPGGVCTTLMTMDDFSRVFSIGSSDLLWGLARGESGSDSSEVATSEGPATSSTDRPE